MNGVIERVRLPEFTGENRCWPCTLLNGLLLWIAVAVLTILGQPVLGVVVGVLGLAAIALRGYLLPFTPRFAPQLVSLLPGDPFDHDREPGSFGDVGPAGEDETTDAEPPSGEVILSALVDADVVEVDGDDVFLEPSIRGQWREEMTRLRTFDVDELAAVAADVTPDSIDARGETRWGNSYVVLESSVRPLVLVPEAIAVVELAAARVLESHVDDVGVRLAAGRPFRTLLERCPFCEGPLSVTTSTCCGIVTPIGETPAEKLVCEACSIRLFTYD